jgi:membrane-associated protease RseP (regulator of RpoE activity)
VLIVGGTVSNEIRVPIAAAAPGLFAGAVLVSAPGQPASTRNAAGRAARAGEYITVFATGLGPVSNTPATGAAPSETTLSSLPALPTVNVGGVTATVGFAGLAPPGPSPYTAGVYRLDVLVPAGVTPGDSVPLVVSVGGVQSNAVSFSLADGRVDSIAKFVELGPSGSIIARAITSQNTCPAITLNGVPKPMQTRVAATLPLYPVLSCGSAIPTGTNSVSIEGQTASVAGGQSGARHGSGRYRLPHGRNRFPGVLRPEGMAIGPNCSKRNCGSPTTADS